MIEENWKECIENFSARKITPDRQKAKSLIETADERIECINKELNEKNANFVFEDYYTSILELMQAILLLKGYNVKNHICTGFYLRDELKNDSLFRIFDDLRYKRNSLTYYGKRMEFEIAKQAIEKSKNLIIELKKMLNQQNI